MAAPVDDFDSDVSSHNALQIVPSDRVHSNDASHKLSIDLEVKNLFCLVPGKLLSRIDFGFIFMEIPGINYKNFPI